MDLVTNSVAIEDGSREATLEHFMRERGIDRMETLVSKAEAKGLASETPGAMNAIRSLIQPMAEGVAELFAAERARKMGRPSIVMSKIGEMEPDLVAYLTIKETINYAAGRCPLGRLTHHIGSVLEDEVRMAVFDNAAPKLYRTVDRDVKRKSWDAVHAELIFSAAAKAADIELPRWSRADKMQVGTRLVDILIERTGLMTAFDVHERKNSTVKVVEMTEFGRRWIADFNSKAGLLRPSLTPTVVPPVKWVGTTGGGYLTHAIRSFCVVKRTYRSHVEALKAAPGMPAIYRAMNAIQETPWAINGKVLDVMLEADERGILLPGMPPPNPNPLPERPADIDTNEAARRAWKEKAKLVYEQNAEDEGRRLELAQLLTIGKEYRGDAQIYFPQQLDFRGRVYSIPNTLHPQGSDRGKALLHFGPGKPLGDTGLRWLGIHGANEFGVDKVSFDDRVAWAMEHREAAAACARDPFSNRWWTEADKPWEFLSWCFEFGAIDWSNSPEAFVSHLPVAQDGSCNGLQHFSAMLRDPVGGAAVNLVPSDVPQDIYQRVADRAVERLAKEVADARAEGREDEKARWAYGWLAFGLNRKITKRPVMVLPYGGTMTSCLEYTRAAVREQIKDGKGHNFGDELPKAEAYLASTIWAAIGDVVVAARAVMSWLQKVARVAAKAGVPLQWTTPSGFVAHQEYRDLRRRRVESRLRGAVVKVYYQEDTDQLNVSRQALGISPNFVHSMDASAMMLTINRCLDDGIGAFAMIHDSYGTYAADTDRLSQHLRSAFVDMYEEHDVLREFRDAVVAALPPEASEFDIPPLPQMGTLDLQRVRESAYFFA